MVDLPVLPVSKGYKHQTISKCLLASTTITVLCIVTTLIGQIFKWVLHLSIIWNHRWFSKETQNVLKLLWGTHVACRNLNDSSNSSYGS